ncbi:hypothetical protein [Acinetobacter tandoii]
MSIKFVEVYDRSKDHRIYFNPENVEAVSIEWTEKKDYSQTIHKVFIYLRCGHTLICETNDDGKNKILKALEGN